MQKIFICFFLLCVLCAYPDALFAVSAEIKNQLNDIVAKSDDIRDANFSDFFDIEQEIYKLNPELVEQNQHESEYERIQIYRSFIMQKTFDWYKDYFKQRIQERADITGRELKKSDGDWELDNGYLDTPQCFEQNPKSWCYKMPICPRPQGHENVFMHYGNTKILYWEDHADENLTYIYSIRIEDSVYNTDNTKSQEMMFKIFAYAENYDYFFEDDNSDLEFRARYSKYTRKEFEKMQNKTGKEREKINKNFDKSDEEINRILKEKELLYKSHPDVKATGFIMGRIQTLNSDVNISDDDE